jgi:hypothetical protein
MIIEYQTKAAPLPIEQFLGGIALSPSDKATVAEVCEKVRTAEKLKGAYVNRDGGVSLIGAAEAKLGGAPSAENIAKLEAAASTAAVFDVVRTRVERTLNAIRDREIASLGPVAAAVLDRIADNVRAAEAAHAKALSRSPLAATADDGLAARLERTHAELSALRGRVLRELAGLDFLCRVGLASDPFEVGEVEALEDLDRELAADFH